MALFIIGGISITAVIIYTIAMPLWQRGRKQAATVQTSTTIVLMVSLYMLIGAPEKINKDYWQQRSTEQVFADLQRYLRTESGDPSAWQLLANIAMNIGEYQQAAHAYQRIIDIEGEQPNLLLGRADAIAMQQNGNLKGEPEQLLNRVLTSDPNNPGALWMLSMSAYNNQQTQQALEIWQQLWHIVDSDQQKLQLLELISATGTEPPPMLIIHISMEQTANPADPQLPVFVFAKEPGGAAKPIAALKRTVAQLPTTVVLDDIDIISQGETLANYQQLQVSARMATSASIKPSPDDLVATPQILSIGQQAALQLRQQTIQR